MSFDRVVYVATNGNDSASNSGTSTNSPLLTVNTAITRLNGIGTIVCRGGRRFNESINLGNAQYITIRSYPRERAEFWYGQGIDASSFSALSNGIFTATMSLSFSNSLMYLTNQWDANAPTGRGIYLYQTNKPFGVQTVGNMFMPSIFNRAGETNRCEHYPLLRASSIGAMTASNGLWFQQGATLYVKFGTSNVVGGVYLPSTNTTDSFVYGGGPQTTLVVKGIRSYFGWSGFDFSGCGSWDFESCFAFGSGRSCFFADSSVTSTAATGNGRIVNCQGSAPENEGFEFLNNESSSDWPHVEQIGCVWNDYLREGSRCAFGASETVMASTCFGNYGQFGFVSDGSHSTYLGCQTYSNTIAGWQLGEALLIGVSSYQRLVACKMVGDLSPIQLNDFNDNVLAENCLFDPSPASSIAINVAENGSSSFSRNMGSKLSGKSDVGLPTATIFGGDSGSGARYGSDWQYLGDATPLRPGNLYVASSSDGNGFGSSIVVTGGGKTINIHNDGRVTINGTTVQSGTGSPEGAVTGAVGDLYFRTDSTGASYTKTNGAGNTGWFNNLTRQ